MERGDVVLVRDGGRIFENDADMCHKAEISCIFYKNNLTLIIVI